MLTMIVVVVVALIFELSVGVAAGWWELHPATMDSVGKMKEKMDS